MTLTPAYGRDYRTKGDVIVDFEHNKDFRVDGTYTNKEDLLKLGITRVTMRYAKLRKAFELEVKPCENF